MDTRLTLSPYIPTECFGKDKIQLHIVMGTLQGWLPRLSVKEPDRQPTTGDKWKGIESKSCQLADTMKEEALL
jgi:hypothetical protein